jgi:hypothetical protein
LLLFGELEALGDDGTHFVWPARASQLVKGLQHGSEILYKLRSARIMIGSTETKISGSVR